MKKCFRTVFRDALFFLTVIAMLSAFTGCSNSISPNNQADSSAPESGNVQAAQEDEAMKPGPSEKSWTEDEIRALFVKTNQDSIHNFTIVDAVVIPDFAYDRVGAVLYVDNENHTSNAAFLDCDGYYQTAGAYAKLCTDSDFTYCGDGTVTFKLESEAGDIYTYQLSISIDGPNVTFVASDDLEIG